MILRLRALLFWAHLIFGLAGGLFILNMAVSGISIAYERQIIALAESGERNVAVPAQGHALDVESLIANVQNSRPEVSGLILYSDPSRSAVFNLGRNDDVLYVNPYTGDVIGGGHQAVRGFFRFMTSWHRWLALEGTEQPIGKAITGAVCLCYFFLLFSGLCLWLPKRWSRSRVQRGLIFNFNPPGRARYWNWHNVIGFWCSPLLLVVTVTGVIMSYDWANDLIFRVTGSPMPESRNEGGRPLGRRAGDSLAIHNVRGLDLLWSHAKEKVPDWHSISQRFTGRANGVFLIDSGDEIRPDKIARLTLDRTTGEERQWEPYSAENTARKIRSWVRPIHTGEAGGLLGQSVAVIVAIGEIFLVWTGIAMALIRFFGKKQSVEPSRAQGSVISNG